MTLFDAGEDGLHVVLGGRTRLVIVVDDIDQRSLVAAVHGAMTPVEDNIVAIVEGTGHADRRVTGRVAGKQVVVLRGRLTTPSSAKGVVAGIQRFAGDRPLDGDVAGRILDLGPAVGRGTHVTIQGNVFVHTPGGRAVVDDDVMIGVATDVVVTLAAFGHTATYANVTYDHFVGVDVQCTGNADTVTRSRLAGDGYIGMVDVDVAVDLDGSGHAENNDTGTFGLEGFTQATGAFVFEIGNDIDLAATTTLGEHTGTPGTREGRNDYFGQAGRMRGNHTGFGLYTGKLGYLCVDCQGTGGSHDKC